MNRSISTYFLISAASIIAITASVIAITASINEENLSIIKSVEATKTSLLYVAINHRRINTTLQKWNTIDRGKNGKEGSRQNSFATEDRSPDNFVLSAELITYTAHISSR